MGRRDVLTRQSYIKKIESVMDFLDQRFPTSLYSRTPKHKNKNWRTLG